MQRRGAIYISRDTVAAQAAGIESFVVVIGVLFVIHCQSETPEHAQDDSDEGAGRGEGKARLGCGG